MKFEQKKQAVLAVHPYKIFKLPGESYGKREYVVTTIITNGQPETYKYRTEEQLFEKLYDLYFVQANSKLPCTNYELTNICNIFGFREDHARFLIEQQKDQNIFYNNRLSYTGVLWLIANGCQSTGNGSLIQMHTIFDEAYVKQIQSASETETLKSENAKLKKQISDIQNILNGHAEQEKQSEKSNKSDTVNLYFPDKKIKEDT